MGAVGGAEGVVDIVAVRRCQAFGEVRIIRLLTGMKAQILQEHDRPGLGLDSGRIQTVRYEANGNTEGLLQHSRHGVEREGRVGHALGLPEVGAGRHLIHPFAQPAKGGEGGDDAGVVEDHAVPHRDVEVETSQHPGTAEVLKIVEGWQAHTFSRSTMYSIRSTQRRA